MPATTLDIVYVTSTGIAFCASLGSFMKRSGIHLKIFSVLLGVTFFMELYIAVSRVSSAPLYNLFVLPEFCIYAWFYYRIFEIQSVKKCILFFLVAYPLTWLGLTFFEFGLHRFNTTVFVLGAFFTVCLAILYYQQLWISDKIEALSTHVEFWISTGLLIFYSCQLPYLALLNYLIKNHLDLARAFIPVLQICDTIMYCMFTYAFICLRRKS